MAPPFPRRRGSPELTKALVHHPFYDRGLRDIGFGGLGMVNKDGLGGEICGQRRIREVGRLGVEARDEKGNP